MPMLYAARPAKTIQRRMIIDACRRLTGVANLPEYQYVGFGGLEFNDFVDAHNALGIQTMTSIERNTSVPERYLFNKPYEGIVLRMGQARDMLPEIDWSKLAITWLDYMNPLSRNIVRDVEYVVRSSVPGSMVIVSVSCNLGEKIDDRLGILTELLDDVTPAGLTVDDMRGWGVAKIERDVLQTQANSVAREAYQGSFRQLFNFNYSDTSRMLTWGGVVVAPNVARAIENCRFEDLPYIRPEAKPLLIKVPEFTEREWRHFERAVGGAAAMPPVLEGIKQEELVEFADVYRWRTG